MGNKLIESDFEKEHLMYILEIIKRQLSDLRMNNDEKKLSVVFSKKEMMEENTRRISSNLWSMENFHELVEFSQYAGPLSNNISELEREANKILSLERLSDSPYFARIDFKFDDEYEFEKIYIGSSSLVDEKNYDIYIYDWRSPIASVFYRFGVGKAFYDAPAGRITGEVNLKRQYEISKGKLEYFFDADIQIMDEFLRKMLSQNASSKMKTIVETIQKEQDIIIRNTDMDLIMVQGAAGSGKTSVALHRVAYLMYRGLSSRLYADNIVIISPNTLFEQYISNVLPELGEKNVNSLKIEDIIQGVTKYESFQTRNDFLETMLDNKKHDYVRKCSAEFKSSTQFVEILNRFVNDLPKKWIEFKDVYYDGKNLLSSHLMKARIMRNKNIKLSLRLEKLEEAILELVHEQRKHRIKKLKDYVYENKRHVFEEEETARILSIYESTALIKQIRKFTRLNIFELYKKLFSRKYFYALAKGIALPACIDDILDFTEDNLKSECLNYEDALAITFLYLKITEFDLFGDIKQVVIDEAQDYNALNYEIFNLLFPWADFTVLGDVNQTIGKREDLSLYEEIGIILGRPKKALITMDKSFRCTGEILRYSEKFLSNNFKIDFFGRSGDEPEIHAGDTMDSYDDEIVNEILCSREKLYQSVALICKTERDAISLYNRLKEKIDIKLIGGEGKADISGAFIIPIYLSKGLEFDSVLICDADNEHYYTEEDKVLLYIASTRALHRLNLFYTGEMSRFLSSKEGCCR